MKTVNMREAKSQLSRLVREVRDGVEPEIILSFAGEPVAKLVPIVATRPRELGVDHGLIRIAPDFDVVNSEIAELFEGR